MTLRMVREGRFGRPGMIARRSLGRSIERFEIGRYWSDDTGSRLISRSRPADAPDSHPRLRRGSGVPRPRTSRVGPESGVQVGPPIVCVRRRDRRQKPLRTCQVEPEHVSAPWSAILRNCHPASPNQSVGGRSGSRAVERSAIGRTRPTSPLARCPGVTSRKARRSDRQDRDEACGPQPHRRPIRAVDRRESGLSPLRTPHFFRPFLRAWTRRRLDGHRAQRRRQIEPAHDAVRPPQARYRHDPR